MFTNNKLSFHDKLSVLFYFFATIMVSNIGVFFDEIETQKSVVLGYAVCTPILLYFLLYKSLRDIKIFAIWIGFAVYHLFLHKNLTANQDLMFFRGHAADNLQYTIYFVVLFEVLRIGHLKLFGYELVSPGPYGARRDLWEDRKIKFPDVICFFIYMFLWLFVTTMN